MTERTPLKFCLLIAVTICTIVRAVRLRGVSSANRSHLSTLSATWQSMQLRLRDAANMPIVSMNSSTGIPLSTWTFVKTSSAICGRCAWPAGAVWAACPLANATPRRQANVAMITPMRIRIDPDFMGLSFVAMCEKPRAAVYWRSTC